LGYEGKESLHMVASWALKNPEERERIAANGMEYAREIHTYDKRISKILDDAKVKKLV
jgi:spore maturation protein CgeB